MKKTLISLLVVTGVGISAVGLVAGERGERHHNEDHERHEHGSSAAYRSDPQYDLYKSECGDCHMAYPPSMLPVASWQGMMTVLDDHFGDNAELDVATAKEVTAFLGRNAAGEGSGEYGERSWRATQGLAPPLRITETDYFRGQHHEIPDKMVTGNPDVGSLSRCESCHREAELGNFDEHGVRIPGYGRWDD